MISTREYWKHQPTGDIWAVELNEGRVERCCGPFDREDMDPRLLDHLAYRRGEDVSWIEERRSAFAPETLGEMPAP